MHEKEWSTAGHNSETKAGADEAPIREWQVKDELEKLTTREEAKKRYRIRQYGSGNTDQSNCPPPTGWARS
jgi:AAA+ ATPase superfamily predicted ATPase